MGSIFPIEVVSGLASENKVEILLFRKTARIYQEMSQDWKIFAQGITASIRTQNGQNLGGWLQLTGSKRRSQLAQLGGQLRGVDADQLVRSQPQLNDAVFGPVIAGMVAASIAISNGDFEAGMNLLLFLPLILIANLYLCAV